jgi:hypothetical protein
MVTCGFVVMVIGKMVESEKLQSGFLPDYRGGNWGLLVLPKSCQTEQLLTFLVKTFSLKGCSVHLCLAKRSNLSIIIAVCLGLEERHL